MTVSAHRSSMFSTILSLSMVMSGCSAGEESPDDTGSQPMTGADTGSEEDSGSTDSGSTDLAFDIEPFTLTISGDLDQELTFDAPSCSNPAGSSNLRVFWRNASGEHVFVLNADILGAFTGVGEYDQSTSGTSVKLQEEAGGSGLYFAASPDEGDTFAIDVATFDAEAATASGVFSFSSLRGDEGVITASPMPVPIVCNEL